MLDAKGEKKVHAANIFNSISKRYDLANYFMSLGRDNFWRESLAKRVKLFNLDGAILDLATGTGEQIIAMKKYFLQARITGIDCSQKMLELAHVKTKDLSNIQLLQGDACHLPFNNNCFDSVTITWGLRNIKNRQQVYAEALRVLKPKGRFLILELYHDSKSKWSFFSKNYLKYIIPFLGLLISNPKEAFKSAKFKTDFAYDYLSKSVLNFPSPVTIQNELNEAGFTNIEYKSMMFNSVMLVWANKKD